MRKFYYRFFVLGFILFFNFSESLFSQKKEDVVDPVLQEIISYFYPKLPKFINKYGKDKFVSEENINRSSLLFVLYEYDQSLKQKSSTSAEIVFKQDFELLKKKVFSLEEKVNKYGTKYTTTENTRKSSSDDLALINDLTPNMPMLLDSTLNKSEVFNELKKEVELLKSSKVGKNVLEETSTRSRLDLIDKKMFDGLVSRVERLEKSSVSKMATKEDSKYSLAEPKPETSIIMKLSLGISILALLFVAR